MALEARPRMRSPPMPRALGVLVEAPVNKAVVTRIRSAGQLLAVRLLRRRAMSGRPTVKGSLFSDAVYVMK